MATPQLVSLDELTQSQYAQLIESNADLDPESVLVKAEAAIESRLGRRISVASYTERFRAEGQTVWVRNRPVITVTALKRRIRVNDSWSVLDHSLLEIESGPGYFTSYDPIKGYQIEVTYSAGYTDIPEDIKEAVIMQTVLFSYQDLEVYGSGDARSPGILYFNQDIDRLLAPYRSSATVYH
jgi:hypothetical protein